MKIITLGTKNPAKIDQIKAALQSSGILVQGLPDKTYPEIEEDGRTIQENARKKALTYAKELQEAVLSMDNALYFENLPDELQPGQNVRRIDKRTDRPSDEEVLVYYQNLIAAQGGEIRGYWEYAFCYAYPDGRYQEIVIKRASRIFSATRSQNLTAGYPLESLQIDPESGRYFSDLSPDEREALWQNKIGRPLLRFIEKIND